MINTVKPKKTPESEFAAIIGDIYFKIGQYAIQVISLEFQCLQVYKKYKCFSFNKT